MTVIQIEGLLSFTFLISLMYCIYLMVIQKKIGYEMTMCKIKKYAGFIIPNLLWTIFTFH